MAVKLKSLCLATLLAAGTLLAACSVGGEPDIALAEAGADLGVVVNGEVRQLTTQVKNEGPAPLIIEAVTTSCGCTKAHAEPMTIPAGGSGTLAISYDSAAHGPEFAGPVERQVFIASNDPDEPEILFTITVEVVVHEG